jgi:hypothetical protein
MQLFNGTFFDVFTIVGLGIASFIALRCLFIFIYPLFCYHSPKIGQIEENLNPTENSEDDNIIHIYVRNIPIVKIDKEDEIKEKNVDKLPVATMV